MKYALTSSAATLALLAFGGVVGAQSAMANTVAPAPMLESQDPSGHAFCPDGPMPNTVLPDRMAAAVAADKGGGTKLSNCNARPIDFLTALQQVDPEANLTDVSQLEGYLRSLKCRPADPTPDPDPNNKKWIQTSILYFMKDGGTQITFGGQKRETKKNEVVCSNSRGKDVIMGGCSNIDVVFLNIEVVKDRCLEIESPPMGKGVPKRIVYLGDKPLPGYCHGLILAGEPEKLTEYPHECDYSITRVLIDGRKVTVPCKLEGVEREASRLLGKPVTFQNVSTSYYTRQAEGTESIFLPIEAKDGAVYYCWEVKNPDGSVTQYALYVRARDYNSKGVSTITPEVVVRVGGAWKKVRQD